MPTRRWARGRATGQECRSRPNALLPKQSPASSPERGWGAHSHPLPRVPPASAPAEVSPGLLRNHRLAVVLCPCHRVPPLDPQLEEHMAGLRARCVGGWPLQPVGGSGRPGPPDLREQSRTRGLTHGAGVRLCLLTAVCQAAAYSVLGLASRRTTDQVT